MGGASSRAVARPAAEAAAAAQAAARTAVPKGVVADMQRAEQQPPAQRTGSVAFEDEERMEARDTSLNGFLNKLGGSIHGKQVDVAPKQASPAAARRVAFVDDYAGRLPPDALKQLFALQERAAGEPPDVEALLKKYRVDAAAVDKVLRYCCLPAVIEAKGAAGVQAFAEWPDWFKRRQQSNVDA